MGGGHRPVGTWQTLWSARMYRFALVLARSWAKLIEKMHWAPHGMHKTSAECYHLFESEIEFEVKDHLLCIFLNQKAGLFGFSCARTSMQWYSARAAKAGGESAKPFTLWSTRASMKFSTMVSNICDSNSLLCLLFAGTWFLVLCS